MKIILGMRGSSLALAQAGAGSHSSVAAIEAVELQVIKTTGDRRLDLRLSDSGKRTFHERTGRVLVELPNRRIRISADDRFHQFNEHVLKEIRKVNSKLRNRKIVA
jgi:hypothetical protein